ncbi:hypothetical protein BV25DRAFT_1825918 [Artomyces pyxidatus]|uniref:Uncharacterized protein n=1 Tax=Artomyces pyxidatus TaxID=48021 RepID=A0ACB8T0R9_9AGAM|nr:hypothetical protein BV25DRAFT_1825918 [Artomyces pyxidatus]
MAMNFLWGVPLLLAGRSPVRAQVACENYGVPTNSFACSCPPGFGGPTCSSPACGGDIFQNTTRPLISGASATSFGNLTSSGCACEAGWGGVGCNVCQGPTVCQSAFNAAGGNTTSVIGGSNGLGDTGGQNNTLTCNTTPKVWAAGEMSCDVINPTLQAIYPLSSTLTILRTRTAALSPQPNSTSFGQDGSIYAQLWYAGVEQFYCTANSCVQTAPQNGSSTWDCQNLACTCRPNTTFCGAVALTNLSSTIDTLGGTLTIACDPVTTGNTATCAFKQSTLVSLFGSSGLPLTGCSFGECVQQSVIDSHAGDSSSDTPDSGGKPLSGGVIAGLAVVGALGGLALFGLALGWWNRRKVRRSGARYAGEGRGRHGGVAVEWTNVSYGVRRSGYGLPLLSRRRGEGLPDTKIVLNGVSGRVEPGQMLGILGPSGAGKTTLIEILSNKRKSGHITGAVRFPPTSSSPSGPPRIGFVPQQDVLPPMLTVFEALLFAARLRLPEWISDAEKKQRVEDVVEQLGLGKVRNTRIGGGGEGRGISGGEMRRVSIGLELVASPDVLILDEPTSGLDSVSAAKVAAVLQAVAHDTENPTAVIASIHQPSSRLYQTFDRILLLANGHALYSGAGGFAPAEHFASRGITYQAGYNVADHLLDIASGPPADLVSSSSGNLAKTATPPELEEKENGSAAEAVDVERGPGGRGSESGRASWRSWFKTPGYAATFLTQLEVLSGREWKILIRDPTSVLAHVGIASVLGVFCGGLYFHTGDTIAGFQSRIGCLFFLGALIAFSSLSALYNVVQTRPLFLRERSNSYYSPTAWLLSRFIFDVVPLRVIPTIIVSTITYWMAGLAPHPANFFKFLFILVLYTLAMTLFNFLLGSLFRNGGLALLLSALTALYQMTYAGFFVHLHAIPPVLRWLQWLCPLKYALEALAVNEVGAGLAIQDTLQGVPVDVSATLIMNLLFGFGDNNYYRDVLVLFAFIAGFGVGVIGIVWFRVREML